ncbi:hypothetical protein AB1Y20_021827 [Prymnesium parvum]|uniref:G-protein coupled receptors family 2 profile 2 domain-containing protein n=1 Tax=Prymnesium parvum TaxID=97485 RepID=A0AB34JNL0_PRYPA
MQNCTGSARFTMRQYDALDLTLMGAAAFGIVGSGVIALAMGCLEPTFTADGTPSQKAIFFVSMGDFVLAVAYLFDSLLDPRDAIPGLSHLERRRPWSLPPLLDGDCDSSSSNCKVLGAINQYASIFSLVWMFMIAAGLYTSLHNKNHSQQSRQQWVRGAHLAAWTLPAIPVAVVASMDGFGYSGNNCWIRDEPRLYWTWFSFYYGPEALVLAFSVFVYCSASYHIQKVSHLSSNQSKHLGLLRDALNGRLARFTLVFISFELCKFANRLIGAIWGSSFILLLIANVISPLKGLANAFVYGWGASWVPDVHLPFFRRPHAHLLGRSVQEISLSSNLSEQRSCMSERDVSGRSTAISFSTELTKRLQPPEETIQR